jgi:Raf kinase inhibitor-like YbhB/YbcL family protein
MISLLFPDEKSKAICICPPMGEWLMRLSGYCRKILPLSFYLLFWGLLLGEGTCMAFIVRSSSFVDTGEIPSKYTCEGDDISPPLAWSDPPSGTVTFALIVDDPDAPDPKAPKMTWVHWVLFNIPVSTKELKEGISHEELPGGTQEGINDYRRTSYGGPCPPIGRHRYFFKLYALSKEITGLNRPTKRELEKAMEGSIIEKVEIVGTYEKVK